MAESILNTVKKMLGIPVEDTAFDVDIMTNINSTFMVINQLGIGPETVFSISDANAEWSDFLAADEATYSAVKTLIYLKAKMVFDPPGTSFVLESIKNQISEYEWRLAAQVPIPVDPPVVPEE